MKVNSILELIGNTPHLRLSNLFPEHNVWCKLERFNPTNSIKDRIALQMIEDALKEGTINQETTIIEPTSGNTGIGLSMVCSMKGLKLILTMPESMSIERRKLMSCYGAQIVLTPTERGMKGAIEEAEELLRKVENSWMPAQFDNPSNVDAHYFHTAEEILKDFPDGIDYLITGVGTGGHITGCAHLLRKHFKDMKVMAVEPEASPVLNGGEPLPHHLQGIGAGFIPDNLDVGILDDSLMVTKKDAFEFTKKAVQKEGILCGISTGASLAAIHNILAKIPKDAVVLTFNYDTGERYLSVQGLF